MYKRIYDADWIKVDYYNDGKPAIRISEFIKGKWYDHYCDLPTVEAEPVVHAHWVTRTEEVWHLCEKRMMDRHYCSACGEPFVTKVKRCPDCGAHMDEEVADV